MLKTSNLPEELTYQTLLALLTKDDYRNSIICADVVREAKLGNICIVLTERVSHAEILYKKILKQWDKVGIIHGKHSDKLREKTLTSLNNGEITVLTATTQLLGEGFDHPSLNRLFLAQPIRNPAKCEQLVGRVQRTSPGKVDALIYDYIDDHGLTKHQFQNYGTGSSRYNVYKKLGCNIK
jgi:superfamily II DNA or RNA helicase